MLASRLLLFFGLMCLFARPMSGQKTADCDSIFFRDGRIVLARILSTTDQTVTYRPCSDRAAGQFSEATSSLRELRLRDGSQKSYLILPDGSVQITAKPAVTDSVPLYHVETTDGNDYIGEIVREDAEKITLRTDALGEISILRRHIKLMERIERRQIVGDDFWFENPHATRYFFGPNGYGLRNGEGYYQNAWVLFNQVSYGYTPNFSVGAGMMPLFLFGGDVLPIWVTPKISIPIKKDKWNAGAGLLYANILDFADYYDNGSDGGFGMAYGVLTYGSRDRNATVGLGYGFVDGGWAGSPTVSFSAMHRLSKRHFFVTENYLLPLDGDPTLLLSAGGRWVGKRIAIDYGLWRPVSEEFGGSLLVLPWLGLTVPFGNKVMGK